MQAVPDVKDFSFESLPPFQSSSRDEVLFSLAQSERKRFAGSTSSLTGLMSHIYYLISGCHPVSTSNLSKAFSTKV